MKTKSARAHRALMLKTYGHRYRRVRGSEPTRCFYCGDTATSIDHCPSIGHADLYGEDWQERGAYHYALSACSDCNNKLVDRALTTPSTRAAYLEKRLAKEFERRFNLWTDDEIAEMSPEFQRTIRARRTALRLMGDRIRHLERCVTIGDELAFNEAYA